MISIHLDAQTPAEMLEILKKLAADCSYGGQKIAAIERAETAAVEVTQEPVEEPKETKAEPAATLADVRKALLELVSARGKSAAKAILATHDVKSATELTPDTYAAVIAEAKKETEGSDATD